MKNTLRYLLISATVLGSGFSRAHADDEAIAAFGGFLAGVITGVIIENNRDDYDADVRVRVGNRDRHWDRHDRHRCDSRCGDHPASSGYWEVRRVKVWIPGHWEVVRNSCGERIKIWKPGHYTHKTERVWVASRGRPSGHWDRCG